MMWSKLRNNIREIITLQLKDRIDIHCTCYHDAHDEVGEVWITLDGKKIFGGGYYHWYLTPKPKELISEFSIHHGFHKDFYNVSIKNENIEQIMNQGVHETSHITHNLENYLNTPFEECISSNNPIYKAFSLIDRRMGKRRFKEIVIDEKQHPLVEIFYNLRKEIFKT